MVWHLQFSLSLASQPFSQIYNLRFRLLYCASVSLGVSVPLTWRVLGVPWPTFCQLHLLWVFWGGSDPYSLCVLSHAWLACPWCYLVRFLSALRDLPCILTWISPSLGDHLWRESSIASLNASYGSSCLIQGSLLTILITYNLEGLLGLPKALTQLDRIDLPSVGMFLVIIPDVWVGGPRKLSSFFYLTVSCSWSCRCSGLAEEKR